MVLPIPRRFDARPLAGTAQPPPRSPLPSRCQLPKPPPLNLGLSRGTRGERGSDSDQTQGGGLRPWGGAGGAASGTLGRGLRGGNSCVCVPPSPSKTASSRSWGERAAAAYWQEDGEAARGGSQVWKRR